ncbi:MAG: SufE family protein [Bacteroidales bacterium]|nr:SufE family protein [Bacteroidales bacterium]
MQTLQQIQDEVIAEFTAVDDWMDRYQMLIDMAGEVSPLDPKHKIQQNLIDGCQSRVWLVCTERDGRLYFEAESDALIVQGIVSLLIRVANARTPQELAEADFYFIPAIGLSEHLSPTRSNGLLAMVKQIKLFAQVFLARSAQA